MTFRRGEAAHLAAAAATERHVTYNDKVQYKVSDLCVVSFAHTTVSPGEHTTRTTIYFLSP